MVQVIVKIYPFSTAPKGAAAAAKFGSHDQPAADQSAGRPNPPPPPQSSTTPTKPPTTTYKSVTSAGQSGGKPYPPPPSQPSTTPTKPPTTTYKSVTSAGQSGGKPHPPPPSQSSTIPTKPAMTCKCVWTCLIVLYISSFEHLISCAILAKNLDSEYLTFSCEVTRE